MDLNSVENDKEIINFEKSDELINDIFKFKDEVNFKDDTLSLILTYCETKGYQIEEIGDLLSDNKHFLKVLEKSVINSKHFRVQQTDNDKIQVDDNEW